MMNQHCIRLVSATAALTLALGTLVAPAVAQTQACPNPIPIAITTPLTTGLALIGAQARNGVQDAVDEINAAGGIGGKKVALAAEDTAASPTTALNALNRVLGDKPVVVFSSMISPHVFTQSEVIRKAEVPFLVAATNAGITRQKLPWLFRIHVHDGQLANMVPKYVVEQMKKSKPGIIAVGDDYGIGFSKDLQKSFEGLSAKPVAMESYGVSDKDMTAQLLSIKNKGADVIVVWGRPGDVTLVMKQIKQLGLGLPVIGNSSIVSRAMLNNLSDAEADGALAIGGMIPDASVDAKVQQWAKRVEDKTKLPADNFALGYRDAMMLVKDIIQRVGCDPNAIRQGLASTKDWPGLLISYSADGNGDLAHSLGVYRNRGRKPELIGTLKEAGP